MKTRKTLEGRYTQGQVVEVESRRVDGGRVVKSVEKMVVLDVVACEEVWRGGVGLVVKSDLWLGAIDGNLPVEAAHFCMVSNDAVRQAGFEAGCWWGKRTA